MKAFRFTVVRIIAPTVPYIAITVGMHFMHSGWMAILLYHLGICLVALVANPRELAGKLLSGWDRRVAFLVLPLFALGGPILYFLWPIARIEHLQLGTSLSALGLHDSSWFGFLVYYCLVNPWFEELFWRGLLADRDNYGWLSDMLYAGYHVLVLGFFVTPPWILFAFVILTCAGAVWRHLTAKHNGLIIPALAHFIADISVIVAAYILSQ